MAEAPMPQKQTTSCLLVETSIMGKRQKYISRPSERGIAKCSEVALVRAGLCALPPNYFPGELGAVPLALDVGR